MKTLFIIYCLLFIVFSPAFAAETKKYAFLNIPFGVRPAAMAGTFVALADDPSTVFWNPAGIAIIDGNRFYTTYTAWFQETSQSSIIYLRTDKIKAWSFSIKHLSYGSISETTASAPSGTGKSFSPAADLINLTFAKNQSDFLSFGAGLNYFTEKLYDTASGDYSFDAGVLIKTPDHPDFTFGFSSKYFLSSYANSFQNLTMGMSFSRPVREYDNAVTALDVEMFKEKNPIYHLGAEYNHKNQILLTFGVNSRKEQSAGGTFGVGLSLLLKSLKIDLAYIPYEDLGNTYRLALDFKI